MKKQISIFMFLISTFIIIITYQLLAVPETIIVGKIKYHVKVSDGYYKWNGLDDDLCGCYRNRDGNCWFEQTKSESTFVTHEIGKDEVTFEGILEPIDVTVIKQDSTQVSLVANSSNFSVVETFVVVSDSSWFPDMPVGTIIDIPEFTTDVNSHFVVTGTIRQ